MIFICAQPRHSADTKKGKPSRSGERPQRAGQPGRKVRSTRCCRWAGRAAQARVVAVGESEPTFRLARRTRSQPEEYKEEGANEAMDQYKIWDFYQNDESIRKIAFTARARHQFLARQIPSGAQALNIGVGDGGLERILVEKGVLVSALDPSERTIEWLGQELHLGDRARVGISQSIPFLDDEFDVVIMSEVLEHLSDEAVGQTIKEVRRVLKPGGRFMGTVPADENLTVSEVVCPHCGTKFHRWGHLQSFSSARLTSLLTGELSSVTVSRHFFCDFRKLNWKGRLYWIGKQLFLKAGVCGAGENLFFSAIKA